MAASFVGYVNVLDSDTSISSAVTIPATSDYCVAIEGGYAGGTIPTASVMTLAGTTMLPVTFTQNTSSGGNSIRLYVCAVSTSGSQTFAATRDASWDEGGGVILLFCTGVSGVRDSDGQTYGVGGGPVDVTLTTVSGDLCLIGGWGYNDTAINVDLVSQTAIFEENSSSFNFDYYGAAQKAATTTSTQMQFSGNYVAGAAVALIPTGASSTVVNPLSGRGGAAAQPLVH